MLNLTGTKHQNLALLANFGISLTNTGQLSNPEIDRTSPEAFVNFLTEIKGAQKNGNAIFNNETSHLLKDVEQDAIGALILSSASQSSFATDEIAPFVDDKNPSDDFHKDLLTIRSVIETYVLGKNDRAETNVLSAKLKRLILQNSEHRHKLEIAIGLINYTLAYDEILKGKSKIDSDVYILFEEAKKQFIRSSSTPSHLAMHYLSELHFDGFIVDDFDLIVKSYFQGNVQLYGPALLNIAKIFMQQGRYKELQKMLEKRVMPHSNHWQLLEFSPPLFVARLKALSGKFSEAAEDLWNAYVQNPDIVNNIEMDDNLSIVTSFAMTGEIEKAITLLNEIAKASGKSRHFEQLLGDTKISEKNPAYIITLLLNASRDEKRLSIALLNAIRRRPNKALGIEIDPNIIIPNAKSPLGNLEFIQIYPDEWASNS
ncbi:MAG: hypothetical protein ABIE74_13060 [Pseudomonadota bacterium]